MTPQEQVKMLREAMADCVNSLERLTDADGAYRITCITQAKRALAATAPPKPYSYSKRGIMFGDPRAVGGARIALEFQSDATQAEREACLSALNALAEKENAR